MFIKYCAGIYVFHKYHILKRQKVFLQVKTEMGKRLKALISNNFNEDLLENKENIKDIAMFKAHQKKNSKKSLSNISAKSLKKPNELKNVKEEKQKAESSNTVVLKKKITLNHRDDSANVCKTKATNKSEYKFHDSRIAKEAVVLLKRYENIPKEMLSHDSSYAFENVEKAEVLGKSKKNLPECECHSSLILKEAVVILEKYEDIQGKNINLNAILENDGNAKKVSNKSGKGSKRKREEKNNNKGEGSSDSKKSKKQKDSGQSKNTKKEKIPDVSALDFNNDSKSSSGDPWNFKISSWNINGIRAWLEKNGISYLHHEKPDILCIQETKCSDDKLPEEMKKIDGYHTYWLSGDKDGYSGVGLLTKEKPIKVEYGVGISEHDNEGRVITAEYDKFYLVSTYVPNAGRGLVRLDYRMKWDKDFREYLKKLDSEKPVILTGDLNVAHEEIDLANPKTNKKNAGFTKEEREGFSTLLKEGFIDTFRHLYPDVTGAYTFWTYMMNARAKNVGWRLDYFVISERFAENLCDNVIRKDVFGSDHCPITLFLAL